MYTLDCTGVAAIPNVQLNDLDSLAGHADDVTLPDNTQGSASPYVNQGSLEHAGSSSNHTNFVVQQEDWQTHDQNLSWTATHVDAENDDLPEAMSDGDALASEEPGSQVVHQSTHPGSLLEAGKDTNWWSTTTAQPVCKHTPGEPIDCDQLAVLTMQIQSAIASYRFKELYDNANIRDFVAGMKRIAPYSGDDEASVSIAIMVDCWEHAFQECFPMEAKTRKVLDEASKSLTDAKDVQNAIGNGGPQDKVIFSEAQPAHAESPLDTRNRLVQGTKSQDPRPDRAWLSHERPSARLQAATQYLERMSYLGETLQTNPALTTVARLEALQVLYEGGPDEYIAISFLEALERRYEIERQFYPPAAEDSSISDASSAGDFCLSDGEYEEYDENDDYDE